MSFDQVIKTTLQPSIAIRELFEEDTSSQGQSINLSTPEYLPSSGQKTGVIKPYVKLAGSTVTNIENMIIDESGFMPTISLTFEDSTGKFAGDSFPKTNIILETYVKVGNDGLKPLRCDFLVTSIRSIPKQSKGEKQGYGIGTIYIIRGELHVPNIYKNVSKSYAGLSSRDALFKISQELGLGFSENNTSPKDKMTWINPNTSYMDFIQSIAKHAYESESSFFTVFIDKYYTLNYIEVNKQLKSGDFDNTLANYTNSLGADVSQNSRKDIKEAIKETYIPNYLTTQIKLKGTSNYITELSLHGDQGEIIKSKGYRKKIYYYDHLRSVNEPREKIIDFYKEPLRSLDRPQEQYLVPIDEDLSKNEIKKWMCIDYGNTHPEYNAARLINAHNLSELNKINLRIKLRGVNFQVIRGFRIPVFITLQEAERVLKTSGADEANSTKTKGKTDFTDESFDEQLTGYYYVLGAKYYYDSLDRNGFYTELTLTRREWQATKTLPDN
jgi:hypothetical protein